MAIVAQDLSKFYPGGVKGLDSVSVTIAKGEMVGILGSSGAGKTTFFRLLSGALRPTSGFLSILGQTMGSIPPSRLQSLRRRLGVVQQNHNIIPSMSVAHNVLAGSLGTLSLPHALRTLFTLNDQEQAKVFEVLHQLEIEDKMTARAGDLSGGQQQRVAVARVLLSNPELILADEPLASVDVQTAEVILNIFYKLNHQLGKTLLLNLHQVDFAIRYCSRLLVLSGGRLVYDGAPGALDPKEIYKENLTNASG
ncbi:MAG: phosphonate ABC transporter ATP-binding protein [Bacillota bacterium]